MKQRRQPQQQEWWWWCLAAGAVAVSVGTHGTLRSLQPWSSSSPPPHSSKPFRTLPEFYPFYLTEHKNPMSRLLHVIGTTLVVAMLCFASTTTPTTTASKPASTTTPYWQYLPNFIIALSIGTMICEYLAFVSHGFIEFVALFGMVCLVSFCRHQRPFLPWKLFLVGYFFAWMGHFVFEHNRPATFIYPTYSLICDFIMWFQTVTFQLPITKTLSS